MRHMAAYLEGRDRVVMGKKSCKEWFTWPSCFVYVDAKEASSVCERYYSSDFLYHCTEKQTNRGMTACTNTGFWVGFGFEEGCWMDGKDQSSDGQVQVNFWTLLPDNWPLFAALLALRDYFWF